MLNWLNSTMSKHGSALLKCKFVYDSLINLDCRGMQDLLVQTYSGKVVAFSEEEVGVYQGSRSTPTSPLRRLTSQFSKVGC